MNRAINPSAKLLRYPDRLAAWREDKPFAPIGVEIDLTNRCNLGCGFCHFGYTHSRGPLSKQQHAEFETMGDEMDSLLLPKILNELADAGVKSVTFSGGGEPTLYPQFRGAVEIARHLGLRLGLYTNGTRIDEQMAAFIKKHFAWVVVSLDAVNTKEYQQRKQVDAFAKACAGIEALSQAEGSCRIGVSYLLDHENFQETWRMVDLSQRLGADYAEFRPMVHFDLDAPDVPTQDTSWISFALPHLQELNARDDVHVALDKFERLFQWQRGYKTCYGSQFTGVITPNGKMWTCVNRRGFPDSCIGDLTTESFKDVWARVKPFEVDSKCRVLCRADALNVTLDKLATPLPDEEFV